MTDTQVPPPPSSPSATDGDPDFWQRQFDEPRPADRAPPPRPADRALPKRPPFVVSDIDGPLARIRDRIREWRGDPRLGVVVLVVIALVAGLAWYSIGVNSGGDDPSAAPTQAKTSSTTTRASAPSTPSTRRAAPATSPTSATAAPGQSNASATSANSSRAAAGGKLVVHVAGAVAHPGVVELSANARVIDAVEAVGGALPDGDLDRLNLAAKVVDGERVYVARVGQADPGVVDDAGSAGGNTGAGDGAPGGKVNLNTASEAQLEALPGIGPSFAAAIIAERQRRGGFKSVNDLRSVRGIGDKRFTQLQPLVTV